MKTSLSRRQFLRRSSVAVPLLAGAGWAQAQQAKRPNILFVIADDWSFPHPAATDEKWIKIPNFERVAREGIRFTNCFTSNPKCSPSRATILTGRNSWQLKEAVSHYSIFPPGFPVYPSLLEEGGYFVGFTGKGWGPGDWKPSGLKRNPAGPEFQEHKLTPPYKGISNTDYTKNFESFLQKRPKDKPFCFWLGGQEPHRAYEQGSGERAGKNPNDVTLPSFYPNNRAIRSDFLDYALEVEWFDKHLGQALKKLEDLGELDNTLVVVTSDNGMPFPRAKGQIYEYSFHLPMAIRWGKNTTGGRVVDDFINFRDFAPTFMELAGLKPAPTMTGRSFVDILRSNKSGFIDPSRNVMLVGKERHDIGRPKDAGYPVRAIRTPEYLYVHNYAPETWPAGNPETGYRNVDDSPTKTLLLSNFDDHYKLSFGHRAEEELYLIQKDPGCITNLASNPDYAKIKQGLRQRMDEMLLKEGDPRALGNAAFFDTIEYTGPKNHSYDNWLKNQ
jgi:N-sulfoglucosamine sulfohydrolase